MIVGDIYQLKLIVVLDRGVPNKECVAIQASETVNMGQYGLMLGLQQTSGSAAPMKDNLFWFGDGIIEEGDWVFVYTCQGRSTNTKSRDGTSNIYTVHWGRPTTLFTHSNVVPILFRVDAVAVDERPQYQPQLTHS